MPELSEHIEEAQEKVDEAVQKAAPLIESFARAGMICRGMIYVLIGLLAALTASGWGGETVGTRGAFRAVWREPFGVILLILISLGLAGYSLWLLIRSLRDPERDGKKPFGPWRRIAFFNGAIINIALSVAAMGLVIGMAQAQHSDEIVDWTQKIMSYPLGRWITAGAGIGVVVYGVAQSVLAYQSKLDQRLRLRPLEPSTRKCILAICRFGVGARGIVFAIVGIFLVAAAWYNNPEEARGVGGALHALSERRFGAVLLAVTAAGLTAYGIYQFTLARYRDIKPA